jgi:hypothetical protein
MPFDSHGLNVLALPIWCRKQTFKKIFGLLSFSGNAVLNLTADATLNKWSIKPPVNALFKLSIVDAGINKFLT